MSNLKITQSNKKPIKYNVKCCAKPIFFAGGSEDLAAISITQNKNMAFPFEEKAEAVLVQDALNRVYGDMQWCVCEVSSDSVTA